jgi:hypothetical protein
MRIEVLEFAPEERPPTPSVFVKFTVALVM